MKQDNSTKPRIAGGIFIAIGMVGGAIVGISMDQPSAGMVIGLGLGLVAAAITWAIDRRG